jgi:hypothetical protein
MNDIQKRRYEALLRYQRKYYHQHKMEMYGRQFFKEIEKQMESEDNKVQPPPPPPKKTKKKPPKRMTIETSPTPFILSFD